MSENENNFSFSKKNKREVTSFLGHELLYDFISGQLDEERKQAVEEFLNTSKEAQQDLIKILNGAKYAEQLADTVVSQAVIDRVQEPETYLSILLQKLKFDHWPISVKWSIEAMVVVAGIVILLVLIPWDKALRIDLSTSNQDLILAEVRKPNKVDPEPAIAIAKNPEVPEFVDEPPKEPAAKTPEPKKKVVVAAKPPAEDALDSTDESTAEPTTVKVEKPATPAEEITKSSSGSLFRGILKVTNAAAVTPKISEKIRELGGRKAGDVDLGWQKTETSFYYHFTIPEAKYEELKTFLAEYATLDIRKEPHPRVMPDGIIRLILQVEEKTQ